MKLIAKRPCNYGGRQFYIGDEIPTDLVANVEREEKLGVISIANGNTGVSGEAGTLFTQEQVDSMIEQAVAELQETEPGAYDGIIQISVQGQSDGENQQIIAIPAKPEEIQQVFAIMQLTAEEGAKVIADVTDENVLILLHAADSRKTIKNAAKERADKLFPTTDDLNDSGKGNEATDTNPEGDDT